MARLTWPVAASGQAPGSSCRRLRHRASRRAAPPRRPCGRPAIPSPAPGWPCRLAPASRRSHPRRGHGGRAPLVRALCAEPPPGLPSTFLSGAARSGSAASAGRRSAVEHAAHLLRHDLAHDLGDTLAEGDAAPLGIVLRRIGALVIRRHVLGAVARQGADKPVLRQRSRRGHSAGPCRRGGATGRHSCRGRPGPASPAHGCGPPSCPAPCGWSRHSRGRCGRNP